MMTHASGDRISALRQQIAALETGSIHGFPAARRGPKDHGWTGGVSHLRLGHDAADSLLGGLRVAAVHDILPASAPDMAAATGFALALIVRCQALPHPQRKPWLWLRQDLAGTEVGEPYGPGLMAFGLSPNWLVGIHVPDCAMLLQVAEEALRARVFASVLMEPWGNPKALDLTASRRLGLAAAESGTMGLLLRSGGQESAGSVATRWRIRAHASRGIFGPDCPVFAADLIRNRMGRTGQWLMEWNIDEQSLQQPRALSGGTFSRLADGSFDPPGCLRAR